VFELYWFINCFLSSNIPHVHFIGIY
jgi:hypothetical protein